MIPKVITNKSFCSSVTVGLFKASGAASKLGKIVKGNNASANLVSSLQKGGQIKSFSLGGSSTAGKSLGQPFYMSTKVVR